MCELSEKISNLTVGNFSCINLHPCARIRKSIFSKVSYTGTSDSGISLNRTYLQEGLSVLPFRKFMLLSTISRRISGKAMEKLLTTTE